MTDETEKPRRDGEWVRAILQRIVGEIGDCGCDAHAVRFSATEAARLKAILAASPATTALGTQEGERKVTDLELALKAARAAQHPCNDINASPCAWMQNAVNVQAEHARTIEALRADRTKALEEIREIAERIRLHPEPDALDAPVTFTDGWELACERISDAISRALSPASE